MLERPRGVFRHGPVWTWAVIALPAAWLGLLTLPTLPLLPRQAAVRLQAYLELGPYGGICLDQDSFSYDPRRDRTPTGFLAERPEAEVARRLRGRDFEVERVEIYHRRMPARAVVWARVGDPAGGEDLRTFDLRGGGQYVSLDLSEVEVMLCSKNFGSWE